MPTLKGTEASLSYVQRFLCLGSSSINVFIFPSTHLILSEQTLYITVHIYNIHICTICS